MIEVDIPTRGPGYLDLSRADEPLRNAAKLHLIDNITVYENGAPLPPARILYARVSLASDRSFTSYEQARAHVEGPPLSNDLELYWNQQLFDVLLEYRSNPTVPNSRSACASTGSGRKSPRHCASCHPANPCARSSSGAIPAWCASIPGGTKPRCVLSCPASGTFSTAPTTCCSCAAW